MRKNKEYYIPCIKLLEKKLDYANQSIVGLKLIVKARDMEIKELRGE